eukprot:SAG22_NODE_7607_length_724_cov_3.267200_2_plen_53_part_00
MLTAAEHLQAKDAKKKAKEVLKEMDTDGNGHIDFDEFATWWTEEKNAPVSTV